METKKLMQMALECLLDWKEESCEYGWSKKDNDCVEALRAALAQPELNARKLAKIYQAAWEAVSNEYKDDPKCCFALGFDAGFGAVAQRVEPSATESGAGFKSLPAPPKKEWVSLTDEEIKQYKPVCADLESFRAGVKAVEIKLKGKNK